MVTFKSTVRIVRYTESIQEILGVLLTLSNQYEIFSELTVTSINDSKHADGSKHYIDQAVDIRTKNLKYESDKTQLFHLLRLKLDSNLYTVLFENTGLEHEHIHIQVRKGVILP